MRDWRESIHAAAALIQEAGDVALAARHPLPSPIV